MTMLCTHFCQIKQLQITPTLVHIRPANRTAEDVVVPEMRWRQVPSIVNDYHNLPIQ